MAKDTSATLPFPVFLKERKTPSNGTQHCFAYKTNDEEIISSGSIDNSLSPGNAGGTYHANVN